MGKVCYKLLKVKNNDTLTREAINMRKFKTVEAFQKYVRENGTPDIVNVQGILFTMDNYDMTGKEISYGNRKKEKSMFVETENRYGLNKFKDAIVYIEDMCSYRNDIHYQE